MRKTFAMWTLMASLGLAVVLVQGCKRSNAPAPTHPVVRVSPPVKTVPDFSMDPSPDEKADTSAASHQRARRRVQAPPQQVQPTEAPADLLAAQKRQDASLLQQQQSASQKQQEELNRQVEQSLKVRQQMQAEPRIQEAPEEPITQPASPERIQDVVPGQVPVTPVQPTQPQ
jgi:hypothetical protein